MNDIDLTVYLIHDRKDIVLLASCSTTILETEYNEFRLAVDILNNLRDNSLSYHDILGSKCFADRIFAFYITVVE
ncbi:6653_t:CDS:2, partial [Funneliformis caledonium]